ncbi:discoidin domain-containing protein [Mucilaginibacter mali]|uniref:Discoidin domain-containing protein n=1 Tax=Mucilaginibacter mali TaxID=2740462 RepID=A0A7D4UCC1_9SPHI|nr:polysaccharide lyase family 8 super-sandwich domain-containing protein [Mucilaginibacter mali]QKJ29199.1 discoidin domain-containing protein [Mucilaginibacter mali]
MKKSLPDFFASLLAGVLLLFLSAEVRAQSLLSQGKTVTVSSTESGSYPGSNAVDGSMSTKWSSSSASYNEWLYVDLSATRDIDYVQIYFADGRYALTFDIQGTNTPTVSTSWVTMRTIPPGNTLSNLTIGGLYGQYRYVRFNGRGRANTLGYRVAEFRVYGYDPSTSTQLNDISTVRSRLAAESPAQPGDLTVLITSMQANGKWPDHAAPGQPAIPGQMDYTGNNWTSHSLRLNWLACAYRDPTNVLYNDSRIPAKFQLGMRYFVNQHFTSTNWYDTVIRSPQNQINGLMLMRGAIPADSLFAYADYVKDDTGDAGNQGANKTWVSSITIRKGLALDRYAVANTGFQSMGVALDLASWPMAEGVRADNSFHQHRHQINIGGYGKDFMAYETQYMHDADGTAFSSQFTTARRTNLQNVMLNGLQFFGYRNVLDFGIMGRAVTGAGMTANIDSSVLEKQKLNDPGNATAYQNWETSLGGGAFPTPTARHFWMSNMVVSHGANFYMSAKIMSARNKGTEALNNQNLKGYNLPWGATNIMTSGNEYYDIFPTWNWSRIPGTTTEMSEAQASTSFGLDSGYVTTTNTFGGTLAVNEVAMAAFKLDNKRGVTARKAYFFMENMMVCLGNSITATKTNEIVTTINQTKTNGTITAFYGGSQQAFTADSISNNTLQWVHHDNVGYLFPAGGYMSLTNKAQTGTWKSIDNSGSATPQSNQVFNLYVRHSPTPLNRTYYYIVAPNKLASDMAALAANHGFVVDQNTVDLQAIRHTGTNQYAVVFYAAGQITTPDGLLIKSDKPALVQVKIYTTSYRISVCDPEYTGSPIKITLNRNLSGPGAVYAAGQTVITVDAYSGDERGKTRVNFFTPNSGSVMANSTSTSLLDPDSDARLQNSGISIYPNPATNVIYVKGLTEAVDIDVYNLAGRKFTTVHGTQVDVSALMPGVTYFLRIHTHNTIVTRQFIKQ